MSQLQVDVLQSRRNPHIRMPVEYLSRLTGFPEWDSNQTPYKKSSVVFHNNVLWHLTVDGVSAEPEEGTDWEVVALDELSQLNDIVNINNQLDLLISDTNRHGGRINNLRQNVDALMSSLHGDEDTAGALYLLRDALDNLENKVDKVAGKGLSQNDFTDELYTKLFYAEGSKYKGIYTSFSRMTDAINNAVDGDYVDVDDSVGVTRYIYDNGQWLVHEGDVGYTPKSIQQLYESNEGVERFSTTYQQLLDNAIQDGDSRLDNAREWIANTVTENAAKTGTATQRRAWTAKRVHQAANAVLENNNTIRAIKYELGTVVKHPDDIIRDGDNLYTIKNTVTFPYTLSGPTINDEDDLLLIGAFDVEEAPEDGLTYARVNGTWVAIKGSDENFTTAEKNKLEGLEPSNYRGVYTSESDLTTISSPVIGNFADVDFQTGVIRYIYDGTGWVAQEGSTDITSTQIKQMYEGLDNTNAYTDAEKTKLGGIAENATKNDTDENLLKRSNHTGSQPHTTISGLGTAATKNVGVDIPGLTDGKIATEHIPNLSSIHPEYNSDSVSITIDGVKIGGDSRISGGNSTTAYKLNQNNRDISFIISARSSGKSNFKTGAKSAGNARSDIKFTTDDVTAEALIEARGEAAGSAKVQAKVDENDVSSINITSDELHHNGSPISSESYVEQQLDLRIGDAVADKVDKVTGYGLSENDYTNEDKSKLTGIEENATANLPDTDLLDRSNHTGHQEISTVNGLTTALNNKVNTEPGKGLIEDAPTDKIYGRQGDTWVAVGSGTGGGAIIDDNVVNETNVWSSQQVSSAILNTIDDTTSVSDKTYSSSHIEQKLADLKQNMGMNPIVAALIFGG